MNRDYTLFEKVLGKLKEGLSITFTKDNVAEGENVPDSFLYSILKNL